jgi:hypothetical protein
MRLQSAQDLKLQLLNDIVEPLIAHVARVRTAGARAIATSLGVPGVVADPSLFGVGAKPLDTVPEIQRSLALGVAPVGRHYRLAIRLQRVALRHSAIVDRLKREARGEVDIRLVGRVDKRARSRRMPARRSGSARPATTAWYRANTRPLLIGASVGHVDVTAGTIGGFVDGGGTVCLLSNNHVLANEGDASAGDAILQRARFDGGKPGGPDEVARLTRWVRLKTRGTNLVDAAIAELKAGQAHDPRLLRELSKGKSRRLKGLGAESIDEGAFVYKVGRTTGPTKGRVTAFDLDNIVVNYDLGNLRFDGQIEIEGVGNGPFSDGGDSGSLIVNSRMEAVALLFAGSDTGGRNGAGLTFANPIRQVLQAVKSTLLS